MSRFPFAASRRHGVFRPRLTILEDRCVPATNLTVGANIDISRLPGNESEAAVAINPTNPNNIVATTVAESPASSQWVYRSIDGGNTWTGTPLVAPLVNNAISDGQIRFDRFGNLFLTLLDFDGAKLLFSSNGGQTFTSLGTLVAGNVDQPSIAVGPGLTAGTGSIWLSVKDFAAGAIVVTEAPVSGLGSVGSFSTPVNLAGSANGNFGDIGVGPNGQVVVTYESPSGGIGPATIFTNLDPDGLGPQPFSAARVAADTQVGGFHPIPAQPNRTVDAEANLAYDRSGGAHNGRLYLVYDDAPGPSSNDTNIFVRFSDDNGASWSTSVRVNDDTGTNSQFFPSIAVDQTTGNVAVGWYDARNSAADDSAQYFVSASIDGGATFLPNVAVSGLSNANTANTGGFDFGDFYVLDFNANVIRPVWADNSAGLAGNPDLPNLDLVTASITLTAGGGPGSATAGFAFVGADAGQPPVVRLIDMTTGAIDWQTFAFASSFTGGVRVARGDVNGDGTPDLIVAAGPGGGPHVKVYDGATHALIYSFFAYGANFHGGVFVAAGDVNADGSADIITGAGAGGGPHVKVFSGADLSLLDSFFAYNATFSGGVSVAAGDVNADGSADIITGAGPGGGPHVKAFSGVDLSVLDSFFAFSSSFTGGVNVAAGNVTIAGRVDIIVGAGAGAGPLVKVFNGVTGRVTLSFAAAYGGAPLSQISSDRPPPYAGGARVAAIDFNADGIADIVVLPGAGGAPEAEVFTGNHGIALGSFAALDPAFRDGVFVG